MLPVNSPLTHANSVNGGVIRLDAENTQETRVWDKGIIFTHSPNDYTKVTATKKKQEAILGLGG